MREDGVVQIVGITMKKQTEAINLRKHYDSEVCHKCGEQGRFLDRGTWWCAWENKMGVYNLVGRCKHEKRDRNYAVNND
jgi:hypothetical protein|tara:strand:- start:182 stop:418 length:237 start_codon:yes stop_codon:yes gene_type:complete